MVTANNFSRPYGTANPTLTATILGFVNGDIASVVSSSPSLSTTATLASLPGPYPISIGLGTLTAANYSFALSGGTLTVKFTALVPASGSTCNGAYNGTFNGNVQISNGQNCIFIGGGVTGNVQQSGGSLTLMQSRVGGNVQIAGGAFYIGPATTISGNLQAQNLPSSAALNQICDSVIRGNLQYQNSGTALEIGSTSPACTGNPIAGNLQVQNDSAAVTMVGNSVAGNLQVTNNTAATTIVGNTVNGNLQDQSNTVSTVVSGNTVKGNLQDQSNTLTQVFSDTVAGNLQCQSNSAITGGADKAGQKQGQCSSF